MKAEEKTLTCDSGGRWEEFACCRLYCGCLDATCTLLVIHLSPFPIRLGWRTCRRNTVPKRKRGSAFRVGITSSSPCLAKCKTAEPGADLLQNSRAHDSLILLNCTGDDDSRDLDATQVHVAPSVGAHVHVFSAATYISQAGRFQACDGPEASGVDSADQKMTELSTSASAGRCGPQRACAAPKSHGAQARAAVKPGAQEDSLVFGSEAMKQNCASPQRRFWHKMKMPEDEDEDREAEYFAALRDALAWEARGFEDDGMINCEGPTWRDLCSEDDEDRLENCEGPTWWKMRKPSRSVRKMTKTVRRRVRAQHKHAVGQGQGQGQGPCRSLSSQHDDRRGCKMDGSAIPPLFGNSGEEEAAAGAERAGLKQVDSDVAAGYRHGSSSEAGEEPGGAADKAFQSCQNWCADQMQAGPLSASVLTWLRIEQVT